MSSTAANRAVAAANVAPEREGGEGRGHGQGYFGC